MKWEEKIWEKNKNCKYEGKVTGEKIYLKEYLQ